MKQKLKISANFIFGTLVLLAFLLRSATIFQTSLISTELSWLNFLTDDFSLRQLPFFFYKLLLDLAGSIAPQNDFALRLPSLLASSCAVGLSYLIGERLRLRFPGLCAAIILLLSKVYIWPGQLLSPLALSTCLYLLFVYLWIGFYQSRSFSSKRGIVLLLVGLIAMLSSATLAIIIPLFCLLTFPFIAAEQRKQQIAGLLVALLAVLPLTFLLFGDRAKSGLIWTADGFEPAAAIIVLLNDSKLLLMALVLLFLIGLFSKLPLRATNWRPQLLIIAMAIPGIVGPFLLAEGNRVDPMDLAFAWPLVLILIFSLLNFKNKSLQRLSGALSLLLLGGALISLFLGGALTEQKGGVYKEHLQHLSEQIANVGEENLVSLFFPRKSQELEYYKRELLEKHQFDYVELPGFMELARLPDQLRAKNKDYLFFAWSSLTVHPEVLSIIESVYPYQLAKREIGHSCSFLYSKQPEGDFAEFLWIRKPEVLESIDEYDQEYTCIEEPAGTACKVIAGQAVFFSNQLEADALLPRHCLEMQAELKASNLPNNPARFKIEIQRFGRRVYELQATVKWYLFDSEDYYKAYFSFQLPELEVPLDEHTELKLYFSNLQGNSIWLRNPRFALREQWWY